MRKDKWKIQALILLLLCTFMILCGCGDSNNDENIEANATIEETQSNNFDLVKNQVKTSIESSGLKEQEIIQSLTTEGDEEEFVVNITLEGDAFTTLVANIANEEVQQVWNKSMRNTMKDATATWKKYFTTAGFDTNMTMNVLNPLDTDKRLLSVTNGIVIYDFMDEQ